MRKLFKKILFLLFIQVITVTQLPAQQNGSLKLKDPNSWSMVLIPDPQGYVKFEKNQQIMDIVTTWIKANKEELNIELVLCTGDLVESNNSIIPNPKYGGDQTARQQWKAITNSFIKLNNIVPYILCVGNHDMETSKGACRYSQFNSWFPPNCNPLNEDLLVDMFPNASGVKTLENAYYEFVSPHGVPFLIFSLEFLPRDTIVQQTNKIVQLEKYKKYKGIVLTHSYMEADNTRCV